MTKVSKKELKEQAQAQVFDYIAQLAEEQDQKNGVLRARGASTAMARNQIWLEQFQASLSAIFKDKIVAKPFESKKKTIKERTVNLLLSDLHFGANLDAREVPFAYGPIEESRRLAAVIQQCAEYKRQYRNETTLNVHLAGDVIQGMLHDARDGSPLAMQMSSAIHYLGQGLTYLATQFPEVNVYCTSGNHGRNVSRHRDRAVHQKWDSNETVIYFALKKLFEASNLTNVTVNLNYKPFYTFDSFGDTGFVTHGDTVMKSGFPSSSVDVKSLAHQIDKYNGTNDLPISLAVFGHVHTGAIVHLPKCVIVTNGCLVPPDSFAVSLNIHDTSCGQMLWESVPDYILGDSRFLRVNQDTDKDKSLEKIITPFFGW